MLVLMVVSLLAFAGDGEWGRVTEWEDVEVIRSE